LETTCIYVTITTLCGHQLKH